MNDMTIRAGERVRWRAFKAALPNTIPIFAGFWFLGIAYGVYMHVSGFSFVYPCLMALTIFGGSLEFVAVSMLLSPFAPLTTLLVALMIQARHLFYGIAMLDKFKGLGWKRFYLIFGLCDETFSINYTAKIPPDVDRGWFMFWVTALNQFYWVSGSTLGGILGGLITFNTEGLDFVQEDSRFDILENKVALAVPDDNPKRIESYDDMKAGLEDGSILLAMGNSDVPVGQYTQKILTYLGLDETALANAGSITYGSNVKEVTTQVSEAAVDCGIIYQTDAYSAGLTVVDTATPEMCGQVIYPAAVLKVSENPEIAEDYLTFLTSDEADAVFEEVGFTAINE